jgi:dUTP pyrophosphatase
MIVKIKGNLPFYASMGAAGADLRASEAMTLAPGDYKAVPTGIYMEIPNGFECQIRPRSGLAFNHGVTVLNSPGTIDSDYRGEIRVILINHGKEPFHIAVGDRIAQAVFAPVVQATFQQAELSETSRGEGRFGSTGVA